jgi:hypothetical protein
MKLTHSLIRKVTGGAVIGPDGGIWSTTSRFYGNHNEFSMLTTVFKSQSDASYKAISFQNKLYVITTATDDVIIAQRSNHSIVIVKCLRCFVVGFDDDKISFSKCFDAFSQLTASLQALEFQASLSGSFHI